MSSEGYREAPLARMTPRRARTRRHVRASISAQGRRFRRVPSRRESCDGFCRSPGACHYENDAHIICLTTSFRGIVPLACAGAAGQSCPFRFHHLANALSDWIVCNRSRGLPPTPCAPACQGHASDHDTQGTTRTPVFAGRGRHQAAVQPLATGRVGR